jgi:hypothetical protein
MSYEPSQDIVERYARVLVDFALGATFIDLASNTYLTRCVRGP